MSLTQVNTTVDCRDALTVARFWADALGRPVSEEPPPSQYFAMIPAAVPGEQSWLFLQVPEDRAAKNRVHMDFTSDDRAADVERLLGLGAQKVGDYDEYGITWTTLRDVEGNEFCVSDPHGPLE